MTIKPDTFIYSLLGLAALLPTVGIGLFPWELVGEGVVVGGWLWLTAVGWGYSLHKSRNTAVASTLFALFIAGLAYASVAGVATLWLLGGMLAGLAAWDLTHLRARLGEEMPVENEAALRWAHRRQLGWATAVGGLIALLTLIQPLTLSFPLILILVLITLFSLNQLLRSR